MKLLGIGFEHGHQIGILRRLAALEGVDLAAIADPNPDTLAIGREAFPDVPAYEDVTRALDGHEPDMVALTSKNSEKADYITECAGRGIHVCADKPLCTSLEQLDAIEQAVTRARTRLSIAYTLRDHPVWRKAYELIRDGAIGEFVYMFMSMPHGLNLPRRSEAMLRAKWNGGLIVDLGSHAIDCLRWFSGREIVAVTATHGLARFTDQADFQDHGQVYVKLDSGASGLLALDWLQPDGGGSNLNLQIMGTAGAIRLVDPQHMTVSSLAEPPQEIELVEEFRPKISIYADFLRACTDPDYEPALSMRDVTESTRWLLRARGAAEADTLCWKTA